MLKLNIIYENFRIKKEENDNLIHICVLPSNKTKYLFSTTDTTQIILYRILNNIPLIICINESDTSIISYENFRWNITSYPEYLYSDDDNIYFRSKLEVLEVDDIIGDMCTSIQ